MTVPLSIVVLAAGQGKRMQSAFPKVLHTLAGKPILQHVLDTLQHLHPQRVCVVYGHGADAVRERFSAARVVWARQEPQLGTGHALLQALAHVLSDGVVLVLNGDVPLIREATLKLLLRSASDGSLCLLTQKAQDAKNYGRIVRNASGNISAIVEFKDATPDQRLLKEWYTGTMAIPAARLAGWLEKLSNNNAQGEYYLTDLVALAHRDGVDVRALPAPYAWEAQGINSKEELSALEREYQHHAAQELLERGVTLTDPARIDVRGELLCGRDVSIDVNCIFEGKVELGDGVKVGANCILRNVIIGAMTHIEPFSLLEGAQVGRNARIGPYARIRPGTELADDVHIGNFVEIKASQIGERSKANHLSYIGDASVGKDVNIGAGTITCNYDGAHKHRTIIEDNVHIGSDVQLVAPVTVGRGATIGAGATLTKDAPAGELTYTEKKQITRTGWRRPAKAPDKQR